MPSRATVFVASTKVAMYSHNMPRMDWSHARKSLATGLITIAHIERPESVIHSGGTTPLLRPETGFGAVPDAFMRSASRLPARYCCLPEHGFGSGPRLPMLFNLKLCGDHARPARRSLKKTYRDAPPPCLDSFLVRISRDVIELWHEWQSDIKFDSSSSAPPSLIALT